MTDTVEVIVLGVLAALGMTYVWIFAGEWLNQRAKRVPGPDPLRVLDERFAHGEIDEDEYERRRAILTYGPPLPLER